MRPECVGDTPRRASLQARKPGLFFFPSPDMNARVKAFKAIAAMAENRVIGHKGQIPWHLPEDFKWFKQTTLGHILVMGRRTYESIGRPLPGRETLIISRSGFTAPGTTTLPSVEALEARVAQDPRDVWIAGGAEIYSLLLPRCSDLFLSRVHGTPEGDAFFPAFESGFDRGETVLEREGFHVVHHRRLPA
jgi:dihydrofolate reductase